MSAHADTGSPMVRVRATHLALTGGVDGPGDALAVVEELGPAPGPARLMFVPARLPCGECAICRRALSAVCPAQRDGLSLQRRNGVELPERYLTPITDPQVAAVNPTTLAGAGLVAEVLDATARSGLGPGETAVWLGDGPGPLVGASLTARRGCRTFLLGAEGAAVEGVTMLPLAAGREEWLQAITAAETAASAGPRSARPERRLYVYGNSADLAGAALALAGPGATLSFRQGAPSSLTGLDDHASLRILIGAGYHPDLIPEALAALARNQVDLSGLLTAVDDPSVVPPAPRVAVIRLPSP